MGDIFLEVWLRGCGACDFRTQNRFCGEPRQGCGPELPEVLCKYTVGFLAGAWLIRDFGETSAALPGSWDRIFEWPASRQCGATQGELTLSHNGTSGIGPKIWRRRALTAMLMLSDCRDIHDPTETCFRDAAQDTRPSGAARPHMCDHIQQNITILDKLLTNCCSMPSPSSDSRPPTTGPDGEPLP